MVDKERSALERFQFGLDANKGEPLYLCQSGGRPGVSSGREVTGDVAVVRSS